MWARAVYLMRCLNWYDGERGGKFDLRSILCDEKGMSPLEIWCNESQERYVLAVAPEKLELFTALCERERAPFAVIGEATEEKHLTLHDSHFDNNPIDLPMNVLLGKTPKMTREVSSKTVENRPLATENIQLKKLSIAYYAYQWWQKKLS